MIDGVIDQVESTAFPDHVPRMGYQVQSDKITALAVSNDGLLIACGPDRGSLRLGDMDLKGWRRGHA